MDAELVKLIETTEAGPKRCKLSGKDRSMFYRVAVFTGLRASELASMTPESFDLASDQPGVTVTAAYAKNRREETLPIHPSLVEDLKAWLSGKKPRVAVWSGDWAKSHSAGRMLKGDLRRAGIAYCDDNGHFADFHSLRHTFITRAVNSGMTCKAAQKLARHSTITLTMDRYAKIRGLDLDTAMGGIPSLNRSRTPPEAEAKEMPRALKWTGTTDAPVQIDDPSACTKLAQKADDSGIRLMIVEEEKGRIAGADRSKVADRKPLKLK